MTDPPHGRGPGPGGRRAASLFPSPPPADGRGRPGKGQEGVHRGKDGPCPRWALQESAEEA